MLWYLHKIQSSLCNMQEEYLGSGSVVLWIQTPVECLHSKPFSSLIQAFKESLLLLIHPTQPLASNSEQKPPA